MWQRTEMGILVTVLSPAPWPGCLFPLLPSQMGTELGVGTGGNGLEPLLSLALKGNPWQLLPSPTLSFPPPWMVGASSSLGGCQAVLPTELHPSGWFA